MDVKSDSDKLDDVILPGFRFHPTDEELVGFYLLRKIQQRPLPIELIKQVDIYKYDPWDLPKLVSTGEKEWYFYCPRDRKYRNSPRPNRVTGAGFWKATGTDRPIYSSNGTKCIGLKKSLVFYRGRAAKGIKTDWMMHEFRLPSTSDSVPPKKLSDKSLPTNDSWAICKIFKKANSTAQRALSHYWVSPLSETSASDHLLSTKGAHSAHFSSENISCTSETGSAIQLCSCSDLQQAYLPDTFVFSPPDMPVPTSKCTVDASSMLFNLSPTLIGDQATKTTHSIGLQGPEEFSGFSISLPQDVQGQSIGTGEDQVGSRKNLPSSTDAVNHYGNAEPIGFPFSLPDEWKPNLSWDSPNCTSEMSTAYSTSKCYT